jgi:SWI/SNF-related matrix-associated actin-dependent regulator of chromatin subfamily A containing DEAD/H box 1
VTKDSVDENIYEIASRKLVLDAVILQSGAELDDSSDVPEMTMGEILASLPLVWRFYHGVSWRYSILSVGYL